jgi:hypothetical protein
MAGMSRKEIAFLVIGVGLGLFSSLAIELQILISIIGRDRFAGISFGRIVVLIPAVLLISGVIMLAYRKKPLG